MRMLVGAMRWGAMMGCGAVLLFGQSVRAEKDLTIGALAAPSPMARVGSFPDGSTAVSSGTTVCNQGTSDIPWQAPMGTDHPGMLFAFYRLSDGRFEQVGVSDMRHFYFALSGSACNSCSEVSNGTYLAPGCSDATGTGNNADQFFMGPRSEWNPYSGEWDCVGSHFADGELDCERRHDGSTDEPLDHRLAIRDVDLDVAEARFFFETYYVVREEMVRIDNVGFREVAATWTGSQWAFSALAPLEGGPALASADGLSEWKTFSADGEILLHAQTADNGDGTWHYEYALYNLAAHSGVRRVAVPVGDVVVSDMGFHSADTDPLRQWPGSVSGGEAVWETDAEVVDPNAPALLFGELFNYRFDADSPPSLGSVAVQAWRSNETVSFSVPVPNSETTSVADFPSPETGLTLSAAPNPATGSDVFLTLGLAAPNDLTVAVFNASGKRVSVLYEGRLAAGVHRFRWDPRAHGTIPAGVYFARVVQMGGDGVAVPVTVLNKR